jgi:hypothetical protein
LAGLIANVAIGLAFFTARASLLAGVRHWRFLRDTLLVPVVAALPAFALGSWLARTLDPQTLASLVICVGCTALVGGVGVGVVAAGRWQRLRYFASLYRVLRTLRARIG